MYRLLILLAFAHLTPLVSARDTQPNVIVVITDDQGYGDVGAHGNTMIQTPNLDRLACFVEPMLKIRDSNESLHAN
ncbi:MAG: hypothetical protein CMJ60_11065, partial [Planctomycetaceae bacterium]|nr:hypothetical protein [Planctomycetaceae bacterium]